MAKYITTDTELTAVADAIRAKSGGSSALTYPSGFVSEIEAIPTGGGGVAPNDVNFLDYDGTIVASYTAADFANLSALPQNPSHDGLTAQGWNYTLANAKTYVASYGKLDIGQMYITDDGKTRLYITIAAEGRMTVPLYWSQTVANGVTINWGDGSSAETFSGTGNKNTTHEYAAIGDYVISLAVATGCTLGLGNGTDIATVLGGGNNGMVYQNMLKKVEIGSGVTSISNNAFRNCYSLSTVVIPQGITTISIYAFTSCYSLSSVVIPQGITTISSYAFYNCYSLAYVVIPQGVTSIGDSAFSVCYSLSSVVIPQGVTSIGDSAFQNCYGMALYDFTACTSVPTLSNSNAFSNIPADCVILVPASLYNTWKAATNWATYASQIQPDGPVGYTGTIENTGYIDLQVTDIDGVAPADYEAISGHDTNTYTVASSITIYPVYNSATVESYSGCSYTGDETDGFVITPSANNWTFVCNSID